MHVQFYLKLSNKTSTIPAAALLPTSGTLLVLGRSLAHAQ